MYLFSVTVLSLLCLRWQTGRSPLSVFCYFPELGKFSWLRKFSWTFKQFRKTITQGNGFQQFIFQANVFQTCHWTKENVSSLSYILYNTLDFPKFYKPQCLTFKSPVKDCLERPWKMHINFKIGDMRVQGNLAFALGYTELPVQRAPWRQMPLEKHFCGKVGEALIVQAALHWDHLLVFLHICLWICPWQLPLVHASLSQISAMRKHLFVYLTMVSLYLPYSRFLHLGW